MWRLNKPCINQTTSKDIDELISHCRSLNKTDKSPLETLYKTYDRQNGNVTIQQLDTITESKANAIYGQYEKTNNGKELDFIRSELNAEVELCPHCSISEVSNLDHFMPHSKFKALSVCRLNLVPTCSVCNSKKSDDDYNKYIHAYYEKFPEKAFFLANISVSSLRFIIHFHFDSVAINNTALEYKLNYQANKIDLPSRILKASNNFINDLFGNCFAVNQEELVVWLEARLKDYICRYGLNDWRTSIIKGILDCPQLSISVIDSYRKTPNKANSGAGA